VGEADWQGADDKGILGPVAQIYNILNRSIHFGHSWLEARVKACAGVGQREATRRPIQ
jgi:hypothetical protein